MAGLTSAEITVCFVALALMTTFALGRISLEHLFATAVFSLVATAAVDVEMFALYFESTLLIMVKSIVGPRQSRVTLAAFAQGLVGLIFLVTLAASGRGRCEIEVFVAR